MLQRTVGDCSTGTRTTVICFTNVNIYLRRLCVVMAGSQPPSARFTCVLTCGPPLCNEVICNIDDDCNVRC